jgi:hypothetical protein
LADPVPLGPLHQPCFVLGFFWDRVSQTIFPGWLWAVILLISASQVARLQVWATGAWTSLPSFTALSRFQLPWAHSSAALGFPVGDTLRGLNVCSPDTIRTGQQSRKKQSCELLGVRHSLPFTHCAIAVLTTLDDQINYLTRVKIPLLTVALLENRALGHKTFLA